MTTQLCTFAPGAGPVDLGADASGPFWLVRKKMTVELWAMNGGGPTVTAVYPIDASPRAPCSLVAGARSVLYRHGSQLFVGSMPLTSLGVRPWEAAAAVSIGGGVLVRAFAAEDRPGQPGHSFVAWTGSEPWMQDAWGVAASFTAARPLLAGDFCGFVARVGGQVRTEVAEVGDVLSGAWQPVVRTSPRLSGGDFLGDPAGALEASGAAHWAAFRWTRHRIKPGNPHDWSQQQPEVYVDGHVAVSGAVDEQPPGTTTRVITLPALCVGTAGLILGYQSAMPAGTDPGAASVGLVRAGHVAPPSVRTHPGIGVLLAASASGVYMATGTGLWQGPA